MIRSVGYISGLLVLSTLTVTAQSVISSPDTGQTPSDSSVVTLDPFTVSSSEDYGYRKTTSVTTSRVGVPIIDNPQAVEIVSSELLNDFQVTEFEQVFRYSSSVMVGENEVGQSGIFTMRGFPLPLYVNGMPLASSLGLTPYLLTDNIDRIEIAKGPVGLLYGNSTPNGVANYITKKPEFTKATSLDVSYGSYNYVKTSIDTQDTIKPWLAYRLIGSWQSQDARVNDQNRQYTFMAPSIDFRPSDKFEVTAELNYTRYRIGYPDFPYFLAINPLYYQNISNPSSQIINYFKSTYGLSSDAAAVSMINQRWGNQGVPFGYLYTWASDITAITGKTEFPFQGSTVDWWRYSPEGDQWSGVTPESSIIGSNTMADVSATLTPFPGLAVRYHWQHMDLRNDFMRSLLWPNGGLTSDGRFESLDPAVELDLEPYRSGNSDTQQIDATYEKAVFGLKNKLQVGVESDRTAGVYNVTPVDFSLAPDPSAWVQWSPFSGTPPPSFYPVISGSPSIVESSSKLEAAYISYRGSAFDDKLNILAGIRHTKNQDATVNTGGNTPTFGVIGEVLPGIRAFASYSQTMVFTNTESAIGPGVLPSDNAHLLNNEYDKGIEIGLKSDWDNNKLSGTLSYYRDDRDGIVDSDLLRDYSDPRNQGNNPNAFVDFYDNGGLVRAEGVDADITWTPSRRFQAVLNGEYEFTAKTISDPAIDPTQPLAYAYVKTFDLRLAKSPLWRFNLVGKYNFVEGVFKNLSVGGAIRYSDDYQASNSTVFDLVVPAETLIDVFAEYRTRFFKVPTDIHLTVTNITNTINDLTRDNGIEGRLDFGFKF